jgi:hypothetical protein
VLEKAASAKALTSSPIPTSALRMHARHGPRHHVRGTIIYRKCHRVVAHPLWIHTNNRTAAAHSMRVAFSPTLRAWREAGEFTSILTNHHSLFIHVVPSRQGRVDQPRINMENVRAMPDKAARSITSMMPVARGADQPSGNGTGPGSWGVPSRAVRVRGYRTRTAKERRATRLPAWRARRAAACGSW